MIVLGIESTAHTFGVGIVRDGKVIANVKDGYTTEEGGMIPFKVLDHHVKVCDAVLHNALDVAGIKIEDVDLIAFSRSPGMGHALKVGAVMARTLKVRYNIPIIGVNHCIAHLTIGEQLNNVDDAILLYASGANTQIIAFEGNKYRVFGETLDQGIGNFLDSIGRYFGLGFPAGPKIDQLAQKGSNYIPIPYTVKGMDVSFGGLITHVKKLFDSKEHKLEDICYSVQETVFAMLCEVTERALAHTGKQAVVIGGGVGCNTRLKAMCEEMCKARGVACYTVPNEFLVDNGGMIAMQGFVQWNGTETEDTAVDPYERTDDIIVDWK